MLTGEINLSQFEIGLESGTARRAGPDGTPEEVSVHVLHVYAISDDGVRRFVVRAPLDAPNLLAVTESFARELPLDLLAELSRRLAGSKIVLASTLPKDPQ